jgi:signal transduction histidine kinase
MFKRLRYKIAFQFTGLVFALMMVVGGAFIGVQYFSTHRSTNDQLRVDAAQVESALADATADGEMETEALAESAGGAAIRVFENSGRVLYASDVFSSLGVPMTPVDRSRLSTVRSGGGYYRVYRVPAVAVGEGINLQVARPERIDVHELPGEALMFGVVALIVTSLTFVFGLVFARRSLAPAESMFERLRQFTHDAGHELRTPLAAAGSSLDLALKTREYEDGIREAKSELRHGAELLERLLNLADLDELSLSPRPVDLSSLVADESSRQNSSATGRSLEFQTSITPGLVVDCDAALVRQMVANLIANAVKFTPDGGTVRIELTPARLVVRDTGDGIPADALPHVFERFYQADPSHSDEGSGLGLAIVARIVELHGWSIGVESRPGSGSAFTVRLPG